MHSLLSYSKGQVVFILSLTQLITITAKLSLYRFIPRQNMAELKEVYRRFGGQKCIDILR